MRGASVTDHDIVTKLITIGRELGHRFAWDRARLAVGVIAVDCVQCRAFWSMPRKVADDRAQWVKFEAKVEQLKNGAESLRCADLLEPRKPAKVLLKDWVL